MSQILGLITARGGSKGVPGKNVKGLAGKPLIAWSIEAAHASTLLSRTIISTDDLEIADCARRWGGDVPFMRPTELAQDQTPHLDVLLHALHWVKNQEGTLPDYVMLLQPTSPLRIAEDIDAAVALALRTEGDAVISVTSADQHPYLSKLVDERGRLRDFIPRPDGYLRRQAIPPVYTLNGAIYLARCEILFERGTWYTEETYAYIMPRERSLDIDTPWDFHLVDLILRDRQNHGQKF